MKKILITGIGGDIAQSVATILRESRPEIQLIGVDVHAQHGGHLFVDHFSIIPSAIDSNYLNALKTIVSKHAVDAIIPTSEPELGASLSFLELVPGVKWITAGKRVVEAGLDKLETMIALREIGVSVPWTSLASQGYPMAYPCIFKNRTGSGSRAVFVVSCNDDVDYLVKRYPDAIFQELLEPADREVTCAIYRRNDGEVSVLLMLRRLTDGFTGWAKVINDADALHMCEKIATGLDLRGSMNIQLRLTDKGPRVFEINPRFSSTVLMRHRIGYRDVLWTIEEAEGKSINFPKIAQDQIMVRLQGAAIYS